MSEHRRNVACFVILGLCVHFMLLSSVFDIYFQSPVIHGIEEQSASLFPPAQAKRLVVLVADGLRLDKCFGSQLTNGEWAAPYIRHLAENEGVWGRSQTRVPTESRPGHVALLAGFYEDVSAVTRGWKENPVEFDSIFNRSQVSWSWGSPDILHMFSKGTTSTKMFTYTYEVEEEDFADSDPSRLDTWVFQHFEDFIRKSSENVTAKSLLRQDKVIFFLHLLGMDTMGHSRKPWSTDYSVGIRVVDDGVERVFNIVEDFFDHDGRTAYLFTADHGMTDWGSHGSSDLEETSTPVVVWGAGIRKPIPTVNQQFVQATDWNLSHILAEDVNQADLAPLMASLIGIQIPVNSVGVVPVQFFSGNELQKASILYNNARQIAAQFLRHWELKEEDSLATFFRPYSEIDKDTLFAKYELISRLMSEIDADKAMSETEELIAVLLRGIRYFQTYHRISLSATVLFGLCGWMLLLGCWLKQTFVLEQTQPMIPNRQSSAKLIAYASIAAVAVFLCYVQRYPLTYYFYLLTTCFMWCFIHDRMGTRQGTMNAIKGIAITSKNIIGTLLLFSSVELLVLIFFKRWVLSIPLFLLSFWPFSTNLFYKNKIICLLWFVTCCISSTFPLFPPIGKDTNYSLVILSGIVVIFLALWYVYKAKLQSNGTFYVTIAQIFFLFVSTANVWVVASYLNSKVKVPLTCNVVSWTIFASSLFLPSLTSVALYYRLANVSLSLVTAFILLSFTYESVIFVVFLILLAQWIFIEYKLEEVKMNQNRKYSLASVSSSLAKDDLRRAYFSLLMLMSGYFALGNEANVNSFTVTSVFCFVTVFSPFLMGFLLIWKILIPLLAVASVVRSIQKVLRRPPQLLFGSILLLSDILVVNFFFLIRDEGSWLEIGSSISRFVVAANTSIAFMFLYTISAILTDFKWSFINRNTRLHKS